jgi:hypothetical protein
MHPDITQGLAAERIREWRDSAARGRLLREARRARHGAPAPVAGLFRLRAGSGRRAAAAVADCQAAAADHHPLGKRAA